MDPVTHALAGMIIGSKAGGGLSLANGILVASTMGAVVPDLDITARFWGDYAYLCQHRKFSHSLPGLALASVIVGAVLSLLYPETGFSTLALWAALGALSHSLLDLLNSYGVCILWPLYKEKMSLNLLMIFDPFLFTLLTLMLAVPRYDTILTALLAAYMAILWLLRLESYRLTKRKLALSSTETKLIMLPSRLVTWDFIARLPDSKLVGTVNLFKRRVSIVRSLENVRHSFVQILLESGLGRFFREFTPFYHVHCKLEDDKLVAHFMDLRYRSKEGFLHNGFLILDRDFNVEKAVFHPFNLSKRINFNT